MKRPRIERCATWRLLLCPSAFFALDACDEGDRPPPAGASSAVYSPGIGGKDAFAPDGASSDASDAARYGPELCEMALDVSSADDVEEQRLPSDPPPALGGTIQLGSYLLTERHAYVVDGGAPQAGTLRTALTVTGDALFRRDVRTGDGGIEQDTTRGFGYRVLSATDGTLSLWPVCPTPGAASEMHYTAHPESLVLYGLNGRLEVFLRR